MATEQQLTAGRDGRRWFRSIGNYNPNRRHTMSRTIRPEGWTIHDNGEVQRHDVPAPYNQPSGQWRITGAVTLNNFGHITHRWTLAAILADPSGIPWKHKNGKQRTHLTDYDHGAHRVRMSPDHSVS